MRTLHVHKCRYKCQYKYKQDWFDKPQDSSKFCDTDKKKSCKFPGDNKDSVTLREVR